ncbi:MAG TPA: hypothetical protein DCQ06_03575 [Myxococcales bacterium]|nr:hypothetical protein [Myxococcales bacterium]HAN30657.1 hypothetical protein [Myxococcales bacterium]
MIVCIALVIHGVLSWQSFFDHGHAGYFPPLSHSNTTQILSDLMLALALVNVWVFVDLPRRGKAMYWFALHLVATAMLGSFAPLIYLLVRDFQGLSSAQSAQSKSSYSS